MAPARPFETQGKRADFRETFALAAIAQDALKLAPTCDGGGRGRLFLAEGYCRVQAGGSPSGQPGGCGSDREEDHCY